MTGAGKNLRFLTAGLAAAGLVSANAASSPVCTPSRALFCTAVWADLLPSAQAEADRMRRIPLLGFLFGNGVSIVYSLTGGLLSFAVMLALLRKGGFSPVGVSIGGGVSHNIGQLAAASCILRSTSVFWYLPVLLPAGLAAGILTGMLSKRLLPVLRDHAGTV